MLTFDHKRRQPEQFGIRTLIIGVTVIAVVTAIGARLWALVIFLSALVTISADALACRLTNIQQKARLKTSARRFWNRTSLSAYRFLGLIPLIFVGVYIVTILAWPILVLMLVGGYGVHRYFDLKNEIGISLGAMYHVINATFLVYLAVHLLSSLFPHAVATRNDRIPIVVAIFVVAAMHFAIV